MTRAQFGLVLAVAAITGLIGGAAGPWLLTPPAAHAQDNGSSGKKKKKKSNIVKAKEFRLIDDDGNVLARLGSKDDREMGRKVSWTLYDSKGQERVVLFASDRATGLDLRDANGKSRLVLSQNSVGSGGSSRCMFLLNDNDGKSRVKFDLATMGAMTAACTNTNGSGWQLISSVFKAQPLFRLVGNGGGQVWAAN